MNLCLRLLRLLFRLPFVGHRDPLEPARERVTGWAILDALGLPERPPPLPDVVRHRNDLSSLKKPIPGQIR